jgi:NADH pyrophosphatase NudC (nudix superfamily)
LRCDRCFSNNRENAKFCSRCGNNLISGINQSDKSQINIDSEYIHCENCGKLIKRSIRYCGICGSRNILAEEQRMKQFRAVDGIIHNCLICRKDILSDLAICPSCLNTFHYNHLLNWLISENSNSSCPACRVKLEMLD